MKMRARQRAKMQPLPCKVHGEINEYKREKQMAVLRNNHTLRSARLLAGCSKARSVPQSHL